MSFFKLSTGQTAQSDGNFDAGGGNLDPIPEGTKVRTIITEAKWAEYQGSRYINLRHDVADGEYKKRVVFQKLRVLDNDTKKADKAKMMLAAIDANCGWKLAQLDGEPSDIELMKALCNKPIVCRVGVWEMNDKVGNWIQAVEGSAKKPAASKPASSAPAKKEPEPEQLDEDPIPF